MPVDLNGHALFKLSCIIDFILGPSSLLMLFDNDDAVFRYVIQISILGRGIMQIRILNIMHIHSNMHQRFYCSFCATLCISSKWKISL